METNTTSTNKPSSPRSAIDKRSLAALQLAQDITQAAQEAPHASALAESGITAAQVQSLASEITGCRTLFTDSVDEREHKKNSTLSEANTETKLRRLIRGVQTAARLKYAGLPDADNYLGHYYVGERITLSRASLATYGAGIIKKLATDTLPGITPARVAELQSTYESWQTLNALQTASQEAAIQRRQQGLTQLEGINEARRRLQRAADVVFPVGDPAHFAARTSFHLEKNKPFRG